MMSGSKPAPLPEPYPHHKAVRYERIEIRDQETMAALMRNHERQRRQATFIGWFGAAVSVAFVLSLIGLVLAHVNGVMP